MLALNWVVLGAGNVAAECQHRVYLLRLPPFVLIAVAVFDRNRPR